MRDFKSLFNVFSKREDKLQARDSSIKPLTPEFRNRVLMYCNETFQNTRSGNIMEEFTIQIHKRFQYLLGKPSLIPGNSSNQSIEATRNDLIEFLMSCEDDHFFDFIEYIFNAESFWSILEEEEKFVDTVNKFFEVDDLPYYLTPIVREKITVKEGVRPHTYSQVAENPKIILKEDQLTHIELIKPVLNLLNNKNFLTANHEFRESLEDYRKGDYGDCITKCNSSFESVMKIICEVNKWTYKHTDPALKLIKIIIEHTKLEPYFEQYLIQVSTIRNRLSKSHGAGLERKIVPQHIAKFMINLTASVIIFLYDETIFNT